MIFANKLLCKNTLSRWKYSYWGCKNGKEEIYSFRFVNGFINVFCNGVG